MGLKRMAAACTASLICSTGFAGSVSGGGGSTLPGDPVEITHLLEAARDSRSVIDAFLKGIETSLILDDNSISSSPFRQFEKMFRPGTDVFNFLGKVPIVTTQGSCHHTDGSETDASANTDVDGGICLSLNRIQQKVNFANYESEIGALLLHEISHFFGTDEAEATAIQKIAARFFSRKSPNDVSSWHFRMMESMRSLSAMTSVYSSSLKAGTKIHCSDLENLVESYMTSLHGLSDGASGMFLTREIETEYYWQLSTRVIAIKDYLCTLPGFEDDFGRELRIKEFEKVWANEVELTANQYFKRSADDPSTFNRYPLVTVMIKKPASISDTAKVLDETKGDLERLTEKLREQWNLKFAL